MTDKKTNVDPAIESPDESRRSFVKTAAKAAVVAPAVFVLLDASTKPAEARTVYFTPGITLT